MPVNASDWKRAFREHCDGDPALENYVDEAGECRLRFDAGELGVSTVRLEHERRPLRWHVGRTHQGFTLRLINESSDDDTTVVDRYAYELPDQPVTTPSTQFAKPVPTPPTGLFVARNQRARTAIIAPPAQVLKGLSELGVSPKLKQRRPNPHDIEELISTYECWATARIIHHPLSFSFRRRVLTIIESAICDLLYNETKLLRGPASEAGLERIRSSISELRIRSALVRLREEALKLPTSSRAECLARELFPLSSHCPASPLPGTLIDPVWMVEFALRLASSPHTLPQWAKERLGNGLQVALKHNTIIRAARYLVLASDMAAGSKPLSAGPLHEGWEWQ